MMTIQQFGILARALIRKESPPNPYPNQHSFYQYFVEARWFDHAGRL
jgi:hypothetical protein